ncbi:MAG: hypothetical protein WBP80_09430, partial [Planifilum fulgidum]
FLRNCFIPNSTKKAVDPSLSTASPGLSDRVFDFLKKDIQGKREMHPVFLSVPLSHRPPNPARFSSDFQGQNLPTPLIYRATSAAKLSGVEPLTSRFQDGSTAPQPTCQLPSGEKRNKPAASAFYRVPEMKRAGGSPPKFPARPALRMSRSSVVKEKVRGWQGPSSYAAQTRSLTSGKRVRSLRSLTRQLGRSPCPVFQVIFLHHPRPEKFWERSGNFHFVRL